MAKRRTALDKAIESMKAERDVLDAAIRKMEAQRDQQDAKKQQTLPTE